MKTPIGDCLRGRPLSLLSCAIVALGAILWDFFLSFDRASYATRAVPAVASTLLIAVIARGNFQSLGLTEPIQGYWYWAKWSLVAMAIVAGFLGIGLGIWCLLGNEVPIYTTRPGDFGRNFVHMCVAAPIVEELIYRLVLCVPAVVLCRPRGAILLSGIVFAGLHFVYGTPSPENLLGGFLLAWAYLRSGSLIIPLAWHAGGNLVVLVFQLAAFYIFGATQP